MPWLWSVHGVFMTDKGRLVALKDHFMFSTVVLCTDENGMSSFFKPDDLWYKFTSPDVISLLRNFSVC